MGNLAGIKNLENIAFYCSNRQQKLIGYSLISNVNSYPDVWKNYFSNHNTLNFGIPSDKIQNILWRLSDLNFSKNCSIKYVFILGGTNSVDHNSPEAIVSKSPMVLKHQYFLQKHKAKMLK